MRKMFVPAIAALSLAFGGLAVAQTTTTTQSSSTTSAQAPTGMTQEKTTTTKVKDPNGPNTKSKTTSVIGTVKEYDQGKSIKIATSKHKSKSFDLNAKDTTATVDPAVAVGAKVKLTDAKDPNGNHTITVEPYKAAAKTMKHHKSGHSAAATTSSAPATTNP